jgi:hypothetical protein
MAPVKSHCPEISKLGDISREITTRSRPLNDQVSSPHIPATRRASAWRACKGASDSLGHTRVRASRHSPIPICSNSGDEAKAANTRALTGFEDGSVVAPTWQNAFGASQGARIVAVGHLFSLCCLTSVLSAKCRGGQCQRDHHSEKDRLHSFQLPMCLRLWQDKAHIDCRLR